MSDSESPILTYFNLPGRAQPIRLAFIVGGIKFVDRRITSKEWGSLKSSTPYNQLPVLEINGKPYCQSLALLRYVGKLAGLYPTDPIIALRVDQLVEAYYDVYQKVSELYRENDSIKKAAICKKLTDATIPMWLERFEEHLETDEAGEDGYAVGNDMTIADLVLYQLISFLKSGQMEGIPTDIVDIYPKLIRLHVLIEGNERIAAYRNEHANKEV